MTNRTYVYVDGFNLYYGLLKDTKYKWLNLHKLCVDLLPKSKISKIYYFTAPVTNTPDDQDKEWRQQRYWRALETLPTVEIVRGKIIEQNKVFRRADGKGPIEVIQAKEKHTDVHMSCRMLLDAMDDLYDTAAIMSNDSDFVTPIRFVKEVFEKGVILLDPNKDTGVSSELKSTAGQHKDVRLVKVQEAQFSETMVDNHGIRFSIPDDWKHNP